MQKLKRIYRSTYSGENIVKTLTYANSEWTPELEMVPNVVLNTYTTTQAVAIGNGPSRLKIDLNLIIRHTAGERGANSLQSYGCNALYRDFAPDFLIAVGDGIIDEIANSGYCNNNIVYANANYLIKHPGKFYMIPQNIYYDSGAIAAYMAAFDGHKKVFLLGYDSYDVPGPYENVYKGTANYLTGQEPEPENHNFLTLSLHSVIQTYSTCEFVKVMPESGHWVHDSIDYLPNFRQISYRDFVIEADIGTIA
jgi:hypothetical protein